MLEAQAIAALALLISCANHPSRAMIDQPYDVTAFTAA